MTLRGRPGKSLEAHDADGTRQPCRHGTRAEGLFTGVPALPAEIGRDTEAAACWQILIHQIPAALLVGADTPSLVMLCRLWSEWRRIDKVLRRLSPSTKKYGPTLRNSLAIAKTWQSLAARFGLSPIDRTRLHVGPKDGHGQAEGGDPIEGFLAQRGAQA